MLVNGSILKKMRIEEGLTQSQLAKMVGVSQAHIAKIEGGKVDPRLSTINKILNVLTIGKERKCGEIMTKGVITTIAKEKVSKISEIMIENAISQIPVIQEDRIIGIVTEEGIIKNLNQNIANENVEKVMESPLPSIPEDTKISVVRPILEAHSGVLVTREGKLVGIITRSDLLKVI